MLILMILNFVLLALLAYVLLQRFRRSRNAGYLILAVPLVLWSFLMWPLNVFLHAQIDRHVAGESMVWPLSMLSGQSAGSILAVVTYSRSVLEMGLLILGFVWLGRQDARDGAAPLNSSMEPTASAWPSA